MQDLPITLSTAVLLDLGRIDTIVAVLGKEFGELLLRESTAVSETGVVTIGELVGTSHCE